MVETIGTGEIIIQSIARFWPTWIAMAVTMIGGYFIREQLGIFGRLYGSRIGMVGLGLVLFWIFTAVFANQIAPLGPLDQSFTFGMKKALPGTIDSESGIVFLWGGDNLARDIFSRVVYGSAIVLVIAPAATLIAYMVGSTLGLPAGYYTGTIDMVMSFLANLVLAFPVILLFYLLVTPEVNQPVPLNLGIVTLPWSIPIGMAAFFFIFPILFLSLMWFTKYEKNTTKLTLYLAVTLVVGLWLYSGLVFNADPFGMVGMAPNELNIFAAVILGSSPGVFRIVRGLTMDIKTRDYVAAAQTRGERPWYIMLWEILPNARGPLIVDFCLRIGYTTILLGTLGFFGLGLQPESPDWGSMINHGRAFVRLADTAHIALFPAVALMSLVLGLNLLADGLREEALKD
ncbi:ABC transporter permease [Limibaculum sp. M0105]|uniref:ABC transporter permease n=1 Tax=Thermohalobaculum xanthum TaxID=2753746 RepID=A0A8J7SA06_9RHOB|nr:ABC transporter permease [Thermohalobaculum xanthum]MBK0398027.1 ABC transporter permease [Thermohalobaculum xanthum]